MFLKRNRQSYKAVIRKNCSEFFSVASNSSDIGEEIIKQINTLKLFHMEPRNLRKILYRKKKITEEEI